MKEESESGILSVVPGPGKMMLMIQHIQKECDRQVRNIIVHFKKNRDFERKANHQNYSVLLPGMYICYLSEFVDLDLCLFQACIHTTFTSSSSYLAYIFSHD